MAKRGMVEDITQVESMVGMEVAATTPKTVVVGDEEANHPYAFHVSGPRNLACPNWKDLINSSWKDPNYKRTVMACFIQAAYLIELDRQEKRKEDNALAPKWWIPFKYKVTQTLIDERDGSVFGAVLEWDRAAAMADLVLIRPSGAPLAVLALRGTLLKSPTIRRDIEDDLRFLVWENLRGSVRFKFALEALKSIAQRYGSSNVCIAGHSLGAGFALQVGKALAKEGLFVDAHLFNPPSISLAMTLRNIGERAGEAWKRLGLVISQKNEIFTESVDENASDANGILGFRVWVPRFHKEKKPSGNLKNWVPHLYVNESDYICCYYTDRDGESEIKEGKNVKNGLVPANSHLMAKLFVGSKGKQKFLEAHGLEQWWSDDLELQTAIHSSRLITQQLKSLYSVPSAPQF